jgi:hypothetical protein
MFKLGRADLPKQIAVRATLTLIGVSVVVAREAHHNYPLKLTWSNCTGSVFKLG